MHVQDLSGSLRYVTDCRHRRSPRVETDARVDFTSTKEILLDHRIVNIGLDGICLRVSAPEAVGQEVDLSLQFPGRDETFEARGEVMWAREAPELRVGIRFIDLSAAERAVLRRVVYEQA